jgi:predicted enzyme related to lactoylglutathione lyase
MHGPAYFEIQVDNVERAVKFYRTVFDWTFARSEGLPIEYWRIQTDNGRGGLLQRPQSVPAPAHGSNAFVCSMEVTHFDLVSTKILDAGGRVALPKFAVPGVCWQGYFLDTEGNTFGIFQPDAAAR